MQKIARCFMSKIRIQIRYLFRGWLVPRRLGKTGRTSKEILTELTKMILFLKKNEKQLFIFASLLKTPEESFVKKNSFAVVLQLSLQRKQKSLSLLAVNVIWIFVPGSCWWLLLKADTELINTLVTACNQLRIERHLAAFVDRVDVFYPN